MWRSSNRHRWSGPVPLSAESDRPGRSSKTAPASGKLSRQKAQRPIRRRERKMLGFNSLPSAQRFLATGAAIYIAFAFLRNLISRPTLSQCRQRQPASGLWALLECGHARGAQICVGEFTGRPQRPSPPRQQAGQTTAPDRSESNQSSALHRRGQPQMTMPL